MSSSPCPKGGCGNSGTPRTRREPARNSKGTPGMIALRRCPIAADLARQLAATNITRNAAVPSRPPLSAADFRRALSRSANAVW